MSSALTKSLSDVMRPASQLMDIKRLGSFHPTRFSFMRTLLRRIANEKWQLIQTKSDLDEHGYGASVYEIRAISEVYSLVVFAHYLADDERNDRVIAEKWDVTMALCIGTVDDARLALLNANVPLQEAGRVDSSTIVLSRGNRSSRLFNYVVDCLAIGKQPEIEKVVEVGYLYRTTAVYGSGKFGMADWQKVTQQCKAFALPFSAEMLSCYLLRQFSVEQAEHLAKLRGGSNAVALSPTIRRWLGIGNSTGLGMAPYLIKHPMLIAHWVEQRERFLAKVLVTAEFSRSTVLRFRQWLQRAQQHLKDTKVPDQAQSNTNQLVVAECDQVLAWCDGGETNAVSSWACLTERVADQLSIATQELVSSVLLETHADLFSHDDVYTPIEEASAPAVAMTVAEFLDLLTARYAWIDHYDFDDDVELSHFWYRSEEKMEPRLGRRFEEQGQEKELPLLIARQLKSCKQAIEAWLEEPARNGSVSNVESSLLTDFMLSYPEHAAAIERVQSMQAYEYGEIRANLASEDILPLDLLRCKLSFFGVSKYDPKSKLWVRNTMFQGAPYFAELTPEFKDDWGFPVVTANA